ncbi:MAG: hypothetical protein ACRDG3_12085 [Tepidiformaceae bacterium]
MSVALAAAACGGGSSKTVSDAGKLASASAGTPHARATQTALGFMPKLDDIGFTLTQTGKPTVAQTGLDGAIGQYVRTTPTAMSARVEISLYPDVATATSQFGVLSDALQNPPPGLFGPDTTQTDTSRPGPGDEGKSYVTSTPDGNGNFVWSDSYRFGRSVVVVYTLGTDAKDALTVRKAIGERLAAEMK